MPSAMNPVIPPSKSARFAPNKDLRDTFCNFINAAKTTTQMATPPPYNPSSLFVLQDVLDIQFRDCILRPTINPERCNYFIFCMIFNHLTNVKVLQLQHAIKQAGNVPGILLDDNKSNVDALYSNNMIGVHINSVNKVLSYQL